MVAGRDVWYHEEMAKAKAECAPEVMKAEDPLFILYTSGSTGKPKGVVHTTAGYLLHCAVSHKYIFDIHDDDIFWCTADIGWVTGHSYIVYGPLCNGATSVMFEGVPTYPDAGPVLADRARSSRCTVFYTAPTAIRALIRQGDEWPQKYDLSSLRVLGIGRRADQSRSVDLVLQDDRQRALPDCGHLVADGNRRHPDYAAARARTR